MLNRLRSKAHSLRYRLRAFLIVSAVLPLLLVWVFTNTWVLRLYRENTQLTILSELSQIRENMELLMDSMTYMSQQIVADAEFMTKLREISGRDEVVRASALMYLNRRVNVYEGANPNISNLVFFYLNDDGIQNINTALVPDLTLNRELLFSTQHLIEFFGPHPTQSVISDYPAISLVRRMPIPDVPNLYLYMESGYRKLGVFSAVTLDQINAIYTVVSDTGEVVFTSNPGAIPEHLPVAADQERITLDDQSYFVHSVENSRGWRLCVFVPMGLYNTYTMTLGIGFVLVMLVAILLSLMAGAILWRSINKPFRLFETNLRNVMLDTYEADLQTIHVEEFDQNFAYFTEMKQRILSLLREVQQKEQQKATLEVKHLLYKINPHFIHNTLNTLKWYAADRGYDDIESFLAAFNRLMLYNMEKDKHTTLQSELDSIEDYIALQKLKYTLDYTVKIDIPPQMLQTQTPRFMLYPLVENAILHGIEGSGHLDILVSLLPDGRISVRIADTGMPMQQKAVDALMEAIQSPDGPGIGLRYVNQILRAQFGDEGALRIAAGERGNTFEIIIPYSLGDYYAKRIDH